MEMIFDENDKPIDYRFLETNPVIRETQRDWPMPRARECVSLSRSTKSIGSRSTAGSL